MNAYVQTYNGKDIIFYTKHKVKTKNDARAILNIWCSYEGQVYHDGQYNEAVDIVYNHLNLCEVGEPHAIGQKIWRDFKCLHGSFQGNFTPYENCHEFYI